MDKISGFDKLATGVDSQVFLDKNSNTVFKVYDSKNYTEEVLNWYIALNKKLSELGNQILGSIEDNDGIKYEVSCLVNPHTLFAIDSSQAALSAPMVLGPTLSSLYVDRLKSGSKTATEYIDEMVDSEEKNNIKTLNEKIQNESGLSKFLERIYDFYSNELIHWLASNLPPEVADHYTFPGEMNVKIRMPNSHTIQFVLTDIFGNMLKHYNLSHKSQSRT